MSMSMEGGRTRSESALDLDSEAQPDVQNAGMCPHACVPPRASGEEEREGRRREAAMKTQLMWLTCRLRVTESEHRDSVSVRWFHLSSESAFRIENWVVHPSFYVSAVLLRMLSMLSMLIKFSATHPVCTWISSCAELKGVALVGNSCLVPMFFWHLPLMWLTARVSVLRELMRRPTVWFFLGASAMYFGMA